MTWPQAGVYIAEWIAFALIFGGRFFTITINKVTK